MARQKKRASKSSKKSHRLSDDPPAAQSTYVTHSCLLPRVSDSCLVKGTQTASFTAQPVASSAPTFYFTLSNASVTSGFWDQYRLDAVRIRVAPTQNAIQVVTNSTTTFTEIAVVIDYDDSTALTSLAAATAYSNCIILNPGESCERTFKPRMAVSAYSGAFGGFANVADMWVDAASNTVQHYGLKCFVPGVTAAQTQLQAWNVTIETYWEMRRAI